MAHKSSHKGMPKAHGKVAHGHMKKSHEHAMHHSAHSAKMAHYHNPKFSEDLGMSGAEAVPMGHGQFANMPQEIYMEEYYPAPAQRGHVLDDTMTHIDRVNHHAEAMESRYLSEQH